MSRIAALRLAVVVFILIVLVRLLDLQVLQGAHFRQLAEHNRVRVVPEGAPRGRILDRHGALLAGNHTVFRLAMVPQEVVDLESTLTRVHQRLDIPLARLKRTWALERSLPFIPATIVAHIPKRQALALEEERLDLPGVLVRPETVRHYPLGRSAAHLIGYLGYPSAEELSVLKSYGVRARHLIGRMGLERSYDAYLRGRVGGTVVEVDHRTRRVRVLGHRPPESGVPIQLTLDAGLQARIERAFGDQIGAAIVLDPQTGEVLAMVSVPAFAPSAFISGSSEEVVRYLNDADAPLLNRATMGLYAPGSIAKLITASAALEEGVLTPSQTIECAGALRIGDRTFHCWKRDGHGSMTLTQAIRASCNVYFMQTARRLGARRLRTAMARMGWGQRTGWILGERSGSLPKRRLTGGEVAILGIGQGALLITPLQAAIMVSAFANNGWLVTPWILRAVGGSQPARKMTVRRVDWSSETVSLVRAGMVEAVQHPQGTAHRAATPEVSVAGKTGTAQTHLANRPHGWFVGFCPVEHPRVAMAIVAEHGGSGGDLPASVGRTICEYVAGTARSEEPGEYAGRDHGLAQMPFPR